jgi:peptidoglycan/LPS O-acetylase OafA/YrhL
MRSIRNIFKIDFEKDRVYGLDILRALAVLFVVLGHGSKLLFPSINKITFYLEYDGVAIFFVLSGFLIGGILIKILERENATYKNLFNFWIRRWFRTLPNYFLVLFILLILSYFFIDGFSVSTGGKYFLFAQNLFTPHPAWFPEAWSLSVEEWFYLLIPIIVFGLVGMCKVITNKAIIWTSVFILILMTAIRIYRYVEIPVNSFEEWDGIFRRQVLTRLDSLMFGLIGAYIFFYYKNTWFRYKNQLFILGLVLFLGMKILDRYHMHVFDLYQCVFSFSLASFATLSLLPFLSDLKTGNGVVYKSFTYISLISYSMYLLHFSVIQKWIIINLDFPELPAYVQIGSKYFLYWSITILVSILMFKYFERPMMKLREKF